MDYKKLGLRVGLEIHQQLASGNKLFCHCPVSKSDTHSIETMRKLRPVAGELGLYDPAAMYEFLRNKKFIYRSDPATSCLVELDEEPPHKINEKALFTTLQICKLLKCHVFDEVHVMRKTVIDGSSVSGFQRTSLVGVNGTMATSEGLVGIQTVCLEEDSAPAIQRQNDVVEYRLDRLGIPLAEIATTADIHTPEQAQEAAERLGMMLRSLEVVRGIGSIRQDVNISIEGGARVEIKGFQELERMKELIENEVARQNALLEIKGELHKRGIKEDDIRNQDIINVTKLFKETQCNFVRKTVDADGKIMALKLPGFADLLKRNVGARTFGKELSTYATAYGYGITHSDEDLEKYKLTHEFEKLKKELNVQERDVTVILAGAAPEKAAKAVIERAAQALTGVPEETRVAQGIESTYTRPLPGAERMYPESDIPPVKVNKKLYEIIFIPQTLEEIENSLKKIMPPEMAAQLVRSHFYGFFDEIRNSVKIEPVIIANTLLSTLKDMKRRGLDINQITKKELLEVFTALENKEISKDSIPPIMEELTKGTAVSDAIEKYKLLDDSELKKIVGEIMHKNKDMPEAALMGLVMKKVRGRADGEKIMKLIRKEK